MAIEQGVLPEQFWEYSVLEILDIMEANQRKHKKDFKEKVERDFTLAEAIVSRIGYIFADEKKRRNARIYQPWDAYPDLFVIEAEEARQVKETAELQNYKSGFAAYAARWNMRNRDGDE